MDVRTDGDWIDAIRRTRLRTLSRPARGIKDTLESYFVPDVHYCPVVFVPQTAGQSNLEIVKELYQSFAEGDIEHCLALFDEDIEWVEAEGGPYGGTYHGRESVLENVIVPLGEEWEEFVIDTERFVDGGDTIVGLSTYRGTYRETGKPLEAPVAHVWDLEDGMVTRFQQYVDTVLNNEPTR